MILILIMLLVNLLLCNYYVNLTLLSFPLIVPMFFFLLLELMIMCRVELKQLFLYFYIYDYDYLNLLLNYFLLIVIPLSSCSESATD